MEIIILALGIIIGIILTICAYLFSKRNPKFLEKVEDKIDKKEAYIAGSEFDGERYEEDKEIKIK